VGGGEGKGKVEKEEGDNNIDVLSHKALPEKCWGRVKNHFGWGGKKEPKGRVHLLPEEFHERGETLVVLAWGFGQKEEGSFKIEKKKIFNQGDTRWKRRSSPGKKRKKENNSFRGYYRGFSSLTGRQNGKEGKKGRPKFLKK